MMEPLVKKVYKIAYHRNGIGGAPFYVVYFMDNHDSRKIGIVFEKEYHCAVLDVSLANDGVIEFGKNSWRGDEFEPELRKAIDDELKKSILERT